MSGPRLLDLLTLPSATPEEMASAFVDWLKREEMLPRITEEQCADLAQAFMAGYAYERARAMRPAREGTAPPER